MRILLINQFYRPDTAATGQLLADLAEELTVQGHDVHVICSRRRYGGGHDAYPKNETVNGVNIHRTGATGFGRSMVAGRLLDWSSFYLLAMWRAFRLPKMDVCIALTTPPFISLIGVILRRTRGTKLIVWAMDLYPEATVALDVLTKRSILYRLLASISRSIYKSSSGIISLGEVMTQRLVEAGAPDDKITVVHNWVPGKAVEQ